MNIKKEREAIFYYKLLEPIFEKKLDDKEVITIKACEEEVIKLVKDDERMVEYLVDTLKGSYIS